MLIQLFNRFRRDNLGQSLTETAIFLPVIIILLAGVVEVSNMLVTQNRVSTASRAATGFGATNFTGEEWDDTAAWSEAMAQVALNNVTETLDLNPSRWDIYTIKASLNQEGTGWAEWVPVHAFGFNIVMSADEWTNTMPQVQQDVLEALDESNVSLVNSDALGVVATVAYHHRESLLGLDAFDLGPVTRIRGLNVMRVDEPAPYIGCDLFPVAIKFENPSLYPTNYTGSWLSPYEPRQFFPEPDAFWSPDPGPEYKLDDANTDEFVPTAPFPANYPGVPLQQSRRGNLHYARQQDGPGGFGWLKWRENDNSAQDLKDSITYPGNYREKYPGSELDMNQGGFGFNTGNGNGALERDEWVYVSTGTVNSNDIRDLLDDYVDGRALRFVVYDQRFASGQNDIYRVAGFALVNIVGYQFTGSEKWMTLEFIEWNNSCDGS